ncbi:3-oxoacyl-[acyl-carrier-protein] reductase [Erysipelothrix urinaevulpis]|uniref:3-oxoacyl-[acyl-carrier-protein] reductase n=1 Tax=Erysipelothrix urinaevulpis TaxID=2683717 RepID=UPI001359BA23|nr:3-oxoacyl-[acyl-carrier-protein] reductase [Erysipelothrix urinaevulpis]
MNKKIAIVTGATKGLGLAIAKQLVSDDYYVIGTYISDYPGEYLESIQDKNFELRQVDSSNYDECLEFSKTIKAEFNHVSVLINNAGIVKDKLLISMSPDDFKTVIDVNLTGVFNMTKAFSKGMLRQRFGNIVNITSVIGEIGNVGQANYAASKAGLIGFSKSIAKEFAPRNIRVNCVAPGFIETDMTHNLTDDLKKDILDNIALSQLGKAEDVAHAVSFLVSEQARYITGQVLNVCGGMVI